MNPSEISGDIRKLDLMLASPFERLDFNPEQQAVIDSNEPNILCLAGAGSGKTRTLCGRIMRLIRDGHDPKSMVVVTYTTSAARELETRIGQKLGYIGTLHGFMLRLIQVPGEKLSILDERQAEELLMRCAVEMRYKGSKTDLRQALEVGGSSLPARGTSTFPMANEMACLVVKRFERELTNHRLVTFDGILRRGLAQIKLIGVRGYKFLCVDEFQDVAEIDAEIYCALPIENKFYTGDPDQGIFGWRRQSGIGIDMANRVAGAARHGMKVFTLETNYRSDVRICEAANKLIAHNQSRVEKIIRPVTHAPGIIKVNAFENDGNELFHVAKQIEHQRWSVKYDSSFAILMRTNALVDWWAERLSGLGIPIAKMRTSMPQGWEDTKQIVAFLADPENDWLAFQYCARIGSEETANGLRLAAKSKGCSIYSLLSPAHSVTLPPPSIDGYSQACVRHGASPETVSIIKEIIQDLNPEATGEDLLLAMNEYQARAVVKTEGVTVSTIHGAKGLEFDFVFMPAFEQEIMPGKATGEELAEARRLAFVGFTRARHGLFISHAKTRRLYGPETAGTPSQFIQEAGL